MSETIAKELKYHFETITPSDFELELTCNTSNRLFKFLLEQAKLKTKGTARAQLPDEFYIDSRYLNWTKITIKSIIKNISNEIIKDGIVLSDYFVKNVKYKKIDKLWEVKIYVNGYYNRL